MTKNYEGLYSPFTREQVQDMLTWDPEEALARGYKNLERNGRLMGDVLVYRHLLIIGVIEESIKL